MTASRPQSRPDRPYNQALIELDTTMLVTATSTPTAVAGLATGRAYRIQNQSPATGILAAALDSAPAATASGLIVRANRNEAIRVESGQSLYLWTRGGDARAWLDAKP